MAMTDEDLDAIEQMASDHSRQGRTSIHRFLATDVPMLVAEVRRLRKVEAAVTQMLRDSVSSRVMYHRQAIHTQRMSIEAWERFIDGVAVDSRADD